ncbi:MAG: CCA tRNA nucleotidyltransferase [Promethearchaeati archaeon SRVP18_Atabeyarchaeia-1]
MPNSKIDQVCIEMLREVKPGPAERAKLSASVSKVIDRLKNQILQLGIGAYPELEGSVAHGTWISGVRDIDVFIIFPLQTPLDQIKKTGLELGKQVSDGNWRERYAEHPFIEAVIDDYRIDIVPCYRISKFSERVTSVDRTPLHTEYLAKRLTDKERDETILLKAFMKGIGVYGAELRVKGFSGYLCELLTLHYGSLEQVLRGVLRWKTREVIDIEQHYSDSDTLAEVFGEPLIVVDPIDPTRNVAAAVSADRIAEIKAAARFFLSDPSALFFRPPKMKPLSNSRLGEIIRDRGTDSLFIQLPCRNISPDIVWGELGKSLKAIKRLLELQDFQVMSCDVWSNENDLAVMAIELMSASLPSVKIHEGPTAGNPNQGKFLEAHAHSEKTLAGPWIKDGEWQVELKRDHVNAKKMVEGKLAKEEPTAIGLSKDVGKWIKEGGKVLLNEEILPTYSADEGFAVFLTKFYGKRPSWLR